MNLTEKEEATALWRDACRRSWGRQRSTLGPHLHVRLVPPNGVQVDRGLVGLVTRMWELGVKTNYSCQGRFVGVDNVAGFQEGYVIYDPDGHQQVIRAVEEFGLEHPRYRTEGPAWKVSFAPIPD